MADTKNLCAQIPLTLHDRVCTEKDQAGLTTAQYITNLLTEYYQMKENGGNMNMAMTNYDLTSIGAVSASAKLAHIRANQELDQSSYNAAWLHGYADALTNVADALEHQQELMDSIIGCMGEQYDSAELYDILHNALAMSDEDILSLGFDLPQCHEYDAEISRKRTKGRKFALYER